MNPNLNLSTTSVGPVLNATTVCQEIISIFFSNTVTFILSQIFYQNFSSEVELSQYKSKFQND